MTAGSTEGTGTPTGEANGGGTGAPAGGTDGTGAQGTTTDQNGTDTGAGGGNGSGDQIDLATIQDPAVREFVEKQQKAAKEARDEAARRRQENQTLKAQVDQFQRANETAEQAAQREQAEREAAAQAERQRLETLEQENRDLKVGGAIHAAAVTAKAHNPALIVEMLKAKATLDDKGQVTNLQDLLKDLRQSDSYLFKRASTDAGRGQAGAGEGSAAPATSMNDMIRAAAGRTRVGGED